MGVVPTSGMRGGFPPRWLVTLLLALVAVLGLALALLVWQDFLDRGAESPAKGVSGSGTVVRQVRLLPSFSRIDLAGANDVLVHVGKEQRVVVSGDENLVPLVTTDVRSGTLVIGNRGSFTTSSSMRAEVTVPTLDAISVSGAGSITAERVRGPRLTADLPGTGRIQASGRVIRADATLEGSGEIDLAQLVSRDARVVVAGSGQIRVNATRSLDASVTGAGSVMVGGHPPRVRQSITGTGVVTGS